MAFIIDSRFVNYYIDFILYLLNDVYLIKRVRPRQIRKKVKISKKQTKKQNKKTIETKKKMNQKETSCSASYP